MLYSHYACHEEEKIRTAFEAGASLIMDVLAHCKDSDQKNIVSRKDSEWIRYLAIQEEAYQRQEYKAIQETLIKACNLDLDEIHHFLTDPTNWATYDYRDDDLYDIITPAKYNLLSPAEQQNYSKTPCLRLSYRNTEKILPIYFDADFTRMEVLIELDINRPNEDDAHRIVTEYERLLKESYVSTDEHPLCKYHWGALTRAINEHKAQAKRQLLGQDIQSIIKLLHELTSQSLANTPSSPMSPNPTRH